MGLEARLHDCEKQPAARPPGAAGPRAAPHLQLGQAGVLGADPRLAQYRGDEAYGLHRLACRRGR